MQITTVGNYSLTLGWLIAFFVLVAVVVLFIVSQLSAELALLIGAVALSRLI